MYFLQPVVIDNGSGVVKAGFAGSDKPRVVFGSYVGRPKHERVMPGGSLEGSESGVVGSKVEEHRGLFKIKYPMEHGVVTDWADMEKIWQHVYSREQLNISSEEHPVS
jgi:centractin